jgi:hypothetical protein
MQPKPGRRTQTNVMLDIEALEFMQELNPDKRYGRYLSRLIFEDRLRRKYEAELARVREAQCREQQPV